MWFGRVLLIIQTLSSANRNSDAYRKVPKCLKFSKCYRRFWYRWSQIHYSSTRLSNQQTCSEDYILQRQFACSNINAEWSLLNKATRLSRSFQAYNCWGLLFLISPNRQVPQEKYFIHVAVHIGHLQTQCLSRVKTFLARCYFQCLFYIWYKIWDNFLTGFQIYIFLHATALKGLFHAFLKPSLKVRQHWYEILWYD